MLEGRSASITLTPCMIIGFCHVNRKLKVMELHQDFFISGYHVYNEIWAVVLGRVLLRGNYITWLIIKL